MEEIERSAASVEEAVEGALAELGVSEQEARVEILQEPRTGLLGLGSQPAVVRVRRAVTEEVVEPELGGPQAEVVMSFLEDLTDRIGVEVDLEPNVVEGTTYVDVWGVSEEEDMGLLIGKRGHTLDALQEIVRGVVQRQVGERCAVVVDVEDYRKRRRSQLIREARDAARRVKRTGKPEALQPMAAFDRKIVHNAVTGIGGLETVSEGDEPNRHVVIRRQLRQE